ncbi:phospholipase B1, membrane-associated-like [Sitophilus oryzae]|uniref:Phospholipase B1, membrane-associated n=1 Tax=Sitophilus oryzae TaxID=7048 RepID=A0A6J2XV47_SITOR|nr:phospholipase B1, membrane-associated-like [Sitophilus oryzae]XP_030754634.1 phospholipase B1, membrane-associated-like [Sitophilus oryzae]XP_030754635.1 phospholipase B1, membrane-associated-like [Sitophilus oryzae]
MFQKLIVCGLFLILFEFTTGYREEHSILDAFLPIYRTIRKNIFKTLESSQNRVTKRRSLFNNNPKIQRSLEQANFPCDLNGTLRSKEIPTTVDKLRAGDIDIVGAIGDSITAGYGIFDTTGLTHTLYEARGSSFSIGGQETWDTYLTVPNILKLYNPKIYGYSLDSITTDKRSKFNMAEGGAISENMPYMAKVLVKRMKNDRNVDLKKHWKMVTVFFGHNDFCTNVCYEKDFQQVLRRHENDMKYVLRILKHNLPRTVVNILPPFNLREITNQPNQGPFCQLSRTFYCPCVMALQYAHLMQKIFNLMLDWQKIDIDVANSPEFHTQDFTVIPHYFTVNYTVPTKRNGDTDWGYIGPDCFHLSQKGHAKMANDLWNSLFQPIEKKGSSTRYEFEKFNCPTDENPYICTKENSAQ